MQWYYAENNQQVGPISEQEFQSLVNSGRITAETLVWREGWADWQEAGSVFPQLQPAMSSTPEAPPVATSGSDATASYCPGPRRRRSGPNLGLLAVLAAAVLLLLIVLILILTRGVDNEPQQEQSNSLAVSANSYHAPEMTLPA